MFVYVIRSTNLEQPLWKIGHSNNPDRRLKELQTGCPFKIAVYDRIICNNHMEIEQVMHDKLSPHRQRGGREWYRVTQELIDIVLFEVRSRHMI